MSKLICSLLLIAGTSTGWAAGTVSRCNYLSLDRALQGGGLVRFACSGTIPVPQIVLRVDTQLDASGRAVTLSGQGKNTVLTGEGAHVELRGLTIARGYPHGIGFFGGTLTVVNSVVQDNQKGIVAFGGSVITIDASTIRNNSDNGVNVASVGSLTITNSTLSGNRGSAVDGYEVGRIDIINSTLSGNTAPRGAAIYTFAPVTVINSTLVDNSAATGGGIYILGEEGSGTITLINSIVARNQGGDCAGILPRDGGHNVDSDGSCHLDPAKGSLVATDPRLGPLADNGGPTKTHAVLPGSPAIDAIPEPIDLKTDQRGIARPQDGDGDGQAYYDLGAVEALDAQCDLDGSGRFDARDVAQFSRECRTGKAYRLCDIDTDGRFTRRDIMRFVTQCQPG